MELQSVYRRAVIRFAKITFPASCRQKKLNFLETDSTFPLPYAFLKFDAHRVQKYMEDPFAYCLVAWATS